MANTLLTINMITNELLLRFKNNLGFSGAIAHTWDDKFAVTGAKIGDTLRLRDPVRFTVTKGRVITPQDVTETNKSLQLNTQANVAFQFSSVEMTLSIDAFRDRYLNSAAVALANQVDVDGLQFAYQATPNAIGTPGTPLTMFDNAWQAGQTLDENSAPMDGKRTMCINPATQTVALKAGTPLFQSSTQIGNQYVRGRMGQMGGFEWVMDQNVQTHTVGPQGGAPTVTGGGQTGSSLLTGGWTAAAAVRLNKGDIFTLPSVYGVNPVSGAQSSTLQKFVVTSAFSSDASGNGTISIYPPIITTGPTKTVTASPAGGAGLTVIGTAGTLSPQSLAFHESAFCIGMAPLEVPQGVHMSASQVDPDTGVSLRTVMFYDGINDLFICRVDALYGFAAQRPEWAVRLES